MFFLLSLHRLQKSRILNQPMYLKQIQKQINFPCFCKFITFELPIASIWNKAPTQLCTWLISELSSDWSSWASAKETFCTYALLSLHKVTRSRMDCLRIWTIFIRFSDCFWYLETELNNKVFLLWHQHLHTSQTWHQ